MPKGGALLLTSASRRVSPLGCMSIRPALIAPAARPWMARATNSHALLRAAEKIPMVTISVPSDTIRVGRRPT